MVFAIRHGVLGYEAMGLNRLFLNLPFGVFIYEATRSRIPGGFRLYKEEPNCQSARHEFLPRRP